MNRTKTDDCQNGHLHGKGKIQQELISLWRSLADHPGLYTATLMTGAGALAGVSSHMATALGYGQAALVGAAIMGVCAWVPVLCTAWKRRHQ